MTDFGTAYPLAGLGTEAATAITPGLPLSWSVEPLIDPLVPLTTVKVAVVPLESEALREMPCAE